MMEQGYQALQEKIFNLQLTVQKQEEELRLYRNGTTATELFDLIHEKDIEIETWRAKCEEKDEKLKKLAKTSGDVLLKYEKLQDDLQAIYDEKHGLEDGLRRALEAKGSGDNRARQIEEELAALRKEIAGKDDQIGSLRLQMWESGQQQEQQGAALSDAHIARMEAETEAKQLRDYQRDLEAVIADQTQELAEAGAEAKKWKQYVAEQDTSIEKLQKRCAALVSEKADTLRNLDLERQEMIGHVQSFREAMSQNLAQRDEALKRREDKVRELQFQISVLQQEAKMRAKRVLGERTNTLSALSAGAQEGRKDQGVVPGPPALPASSL